MVMDLFNSIKNDWEVLDGTETIVLARDADHLQIRVAGVSSNEITDAAVSGLPTFGTERQSQMFSLPFVNCQGMVPRQGDTITQANEKVWSIDSLTESTCGTRYKAACFRVYE